MLEVPLSTNCKLETQETQECNSVQVGRSTDLEGGGVTSSLRPMAWKTGPCCLEQEKMDVQSQQTASLRPIAWKTGPCCLEQEKMDVQSQQTTSWPSSALLLRVWVTPSTLGSVLFFL